MKLNEVLVWLDTQEKKNMGQETCFITKEPIQHKMTLQCNHSFEYNALYTYYIKNQKRFNSHQCPYCRQSFPLFIPFNEKAMTDVPKVRNCFANNYITCSYIFKNGEKKGCVCNKPGHIFKEGHYCFRHKPRINKNERVGPMEICKQTLKNGNPCSCKVYDKDSQLCKRHYNLKNKELNKSSL